MLLRLSRCLMNAADGSPGGGAMPPATGTPAAAPAAAGAPATQAQGAPQIDRATEEALIKRGRDAAYAELRRSGALKKSFVAQQDGQPARPTENEPAKPFSLDPSQGRRLDRALTRSGHSSTLSDKAYERLEQAFANEQPEDVDGWVKEYFGGFGVAQPAGAAPPATAAAATTTPPAPVAATPVTDRGAPASPKLQLEEANLLTLSDADRKALLRQKGIRWYTTRLREQLRGVRVKVTAQG